MKRKLLVLLAAILCITMLLVSCNKCKEHTDKNADGFCDTCSATITPAADNGGEEGEEPVDMVVNPIPEGVSPTEFLSTVFGSGANLIEKSIKLEGDIVGAVKVKNQITNRPDGTGVVYDEKYIIALDKSTKVETYKADDPTAVDYVTTTHIFSVYDVVADKTIDLPTSSYKSTDRFTITANVSLYNNYFIYTTETFYMSYLFGPEEEVPANTSETIYYTYAGEKIVSLKSGESVDNISAENGVLYTVAEGVTYASDLKTGKILYSANSDIFVKRPDFDHVYGNYGYVEIFDSNSGYLSKIYVYDLTKWVECVATYTAPSAFEELSHFYLANGNVLIQTVKYLDYNSETYDIIMMGQKVDIVYTILDTATNTTKEVEFGYYITTLDNRSYLESDYMLKLYNKVYTDKAENLATVIAIKDKRLTTESLNLVLDNDLNIKYHFDTGIFGQSGILTLVADGYYAVKLSYAEGTDVYAVVDSNFNFVSYLPEGYQLPTGYDQITVDPNYSWTEMAHDGFLVVDNERVYTYDMKLKLDLGAADCKYDLVYSGYSYIVLEEEIEIPNPDNPEDPPTIDYVYYYYNPAKNAAPVAIVGETVSAGFAYIMTETVETVEGVTTYTYTVYNALNAQVATYKTDIQDGVSIEPVSYGYNVVDGYYTITQRVTENVNEVPTVNTYTYILK